METQLTSSREKSRVGRIVLIAVAAVLAVTLGAVALFRPSTGARPLVDGETVAVKRGPLVISVTRPGTIQALAPVIISCALESGAQILTLIEEGTHVEQGDLLIELDTSRLQDRIVEQRIALQKAEASFINARESLEVARSQTQSDISTAELVYRFAQEDLVKYEEGDYPMLVKQAETGIKLAETDLSRAQNKLAGSKRLLDRGFLTEMEYEADKRAAQKAELDMELTLANMDLLKDYTYPRAIEQLKSNIHEGEMALARTNLKAAANIVQAEASLSAEHARFELSQAKFAKMQDQLKTATIYAPTGGLVVYATSGKSGGHGRPRIEPLEEGTMVKHRQELIHLSTASSVMARVDIQETSLNKVKQGLPARITVEALPGRNFTGEVARIAPMPDARSAFMNPDLKVYATEIHLDGDGNDLRTGMTCSAEIIVEVYDDALYIPVQSVLRVGRQPTVYAMEGGVPVPRDVEIGLDNGRMIRIIGGLEEGQAVLLSPPLAAANKNFEEELAAAGIGQLLDGAVRDQGNGLVIDGDGDG